MTTSCTELLEALRAKASPLPWHVEERPVGSRGAGWCGIHTGLGLDHADIAYLNGPDFARSKANAASTLLAIDHLGPCVKALEGIAEDKCYCDSHGPRDEGPDCPHEISKAALAAVRRDLLEVLQ